MRGAMDQLVPTRSNLNSFSPDRGDEQDVKSSIVTTGAAWQSPGSWSATRRAGQGQGAQLPARASPGGTGTPGRRWWWRRQVSGAVPDARGNNVNGDGAAVGSRG